MSIHQFFTNNDDTNYFHSSSYGKIAHGDRIGSLGRRTFGERYSVERNRKMVQRYHDSLVARRGAQSEATRPQDGAELPRGRQEQGIVVPTRSVAPRPRSGGFHEPPTRSYNPFS